MYQDDGWGARWRIGILTPHADVGPEAELQAMAPPEVGIHAARVPFGAMGVGGAMDPTVPLEPVRRFAEPPYVDDATELLAAAPIHAIAFGFTSSAYVIGHGGEAAMIERLSERAHGLPVVTATAASLDGLAVLGLERIALFTPPWFDAELTELGRAYYESAGMHVVLASSCALPSDQSQIAPAALERYIRKQLPDTAEAIVIGGNGFRSVGVIEALEASTGRPVLTANQILFWAALRAAGASVSITGYGQIFSR